MGRKTIVKVQVPLMTSEEVPAALVYDKTRKHQGFYPVSPELMDLMDGEPKKYFEAEILGEEIKVDFASEVAHPGW